MTPLDKTRHSKYARIVGQGLPGEFQFSQGAIVIAVTAIKMLCPCKVCFAGFGRKRNPPECLLLLRPGAPEYGRTLKVDHVMKQSERAIRLEKRWIARDSRVQQVDSLQ